MKLRKGTRRLPAICISILLIAAITLSFTATALAAGNGTAKTSADTVSAVDLSDATSFVFTDTGVRAEEGAYSSYEISGTALTIKGSGTYVVSGSCSDGSIVIKKNVTDVTLVLNGLTLSASATAPITCNKGSEVTIYAAAGTVNNLADDSYNNDDLYTDETLYPDIENAVIKCKDGSNVTICGSGTINITANGKNGIKGGGDLYEEDADGNPTSTLLSSASLTIQDVTLNITANVNDGLKADKELSILSGSVTVSAADDGIKCDYVLNIGAEGTDGPTILIRSSTEGIEAATLNVYSGSVTVHATDDGINAANSDLTGYSFSYNQYGGTVVVDVTAGDGVDSNGTIRLAGGTLEVYTPSQGDGDPLDSERGTSFEGATVLAVGHLGMAQGYSASTPYVSFGSAAGGMGGFGGMGGSQNALVRAGNSIEITDESGNVLYSAVAVRDASYILFASPDLSSGTSYSLISGGQTAASAAAGTASAGGMGAGGFMGGHGQTGGQGGKAGMTGERPSGSFPGQGSGTVPEGQQPPEMPADGTLPEAPQDGSGFRPAFGKDGFGAAPGESQASNGSGNSAETAGESLSADDAGGDENSAGTGQETGWFQSVLQAIASFFRSIFRRN